MCLINRVVWNVLTPNHWQFPKNLYLLDVWCSYNYWNGQQRQIYMIIYRMDLTCDLFSKSYLKYARCIDIQKTYVQVEDNIYLALAPPHDSFWSFLFYWVEDDPFQTHSHYTWAFNNCPLPWDLFAPLECPYILTILHDGNHYVIV